MASCVLGCVVAMATVTWWPRYFCLIPRWNYGCSTLLPGCPDNTIIANEAGERRKGRNKKKKKKKRRRSNARTVYEQTGENIGSSHTCPHTSVFHQIHTGRHKSRTPLSLRNAAPVFCVVFKRARDGTGQLERALSNNRPLAAEKNHIDFRNRSRDYYSAICVESTERQHVHSQILMSCKKKKGFQDSHTPTEEPARSIT